MATWTGTKIHFVAYQPFQYESPLQLNSADFLLISFQLNPHLSMTFGSGRANHQLHGKEKK